MTWGKAHSISSYIVCLLTLKNLITLHTLYKVSCQGFLITNISLYILAKSSDMLNKKGLAVKKCEANQQYCSYSYKQKNLCYQGFYLNDIQ